MSATILIDADPDDCNWISELQRSKGRIPPEPTTAVTARTGGVVEMAYDPNQPRDQVGRFGHKTGGGGGAGPQLAVANDLADFNEIGQAAILGRVGAIADVTPGFPRTPEEMAAGLEKVLDSATEAQTRVGMSWYQDAHDRFAQQAVGPPPPPLTTEQAHAVVAVCSPLREWDDGHGNAEVAARIIGIHKDNKPYEVTQEAIDAKVAADPQHRPLDIKPGTYRVGEPRNAEEAKLPLASGYQMALTHPALQGFGTVGGAVQVDRAFKIARGEVSVDEGVGGTKVRNFYNNLHDPGDGKSVTIDTWQVRAMTAPFTTRVPKGAVKAGSKPEDVKEWLPTRGQGAVGIQFATGSPSSVKGGVESGVGIYPFFASAIHIVAERRGLKPHQVQAIAWTVFRDQETGNVTK